MPIVLAKLPGGRELHALHEEQPISFRMPAPRQTREAYSRPAGISKRRTHEAAVTVDDFGAVGAVTTRRSAPVKDMTHVLALDVPIIGVSDGASIGSAQIGIPEEMFARRTRGGPDRTHLLLEAGVPAAKSKTPFPPSFPDAPGEGIRRYLRGDESEDEDEAERELYMSEDEGAEDGEVEDGEADETGELTEEEARDTLAAFVERVAGDTHATSRALQMLAMALRRKRAIGGATGAYG